MTNKEAWNEGLTPTVGTTESMQRALDWWHDLPIQDLRGDHGWANLCMYYHPEKSECYHFTGEQIERIYNKEFNNDK